jgi:hypothetical protein
VVRAALRTPARTIVPLALAADAGHAMEWIALFSVLMAFDVAIVA